MARVMEKVDEAVIADEAIHHVQLDLETQEVAKIVLLIDHTINHLREELELSLRQTELQANLLIAVSTNQRVHLRTTHNVHIVKELKDKVEEILHRDHLTELKEVLRTDLSVLAQKEVAVMLLVEGLTVQINFHPIQTANLFHHVVTDPRENQDQVSVLKDHTATDQLALLDPNVLVAILHVEDLKDQTDHQEIQIVNHIHLAVKDLQENRDQKNAQKDHMATDLLVLLVLNVLVAIHHVEVLKDQTDHQETQIVNYFLHAATDLQEKNVQAIVRIGHH
jgi:hypothetical protein